MVEGRVPHPEDEDPAGFFHCPECGIREEEEEHFIRGPKEKDSRDPWSAILYVIRCAGCGRDIPAHLGHRWGGMPYASARDQWWAVYRDKARC